MGESTKAVLGLFAILGVIASMFGWMAAQNELTPWFQVLGPLAALAAIGWLAMLELRADREPDYLRRLTDGYFNRDGLCFTFAAEVIDGVTYLDAYFQLQRDKPCTGCIALRPKTSWLGGRSKFDTITYKVECPAAGFGVARVPIPVPITSQGKQKTFEVGASVQYPEGRGRRVRFHDGVFLRTNSTFGKGFETALTIAGAAAGHLVLTRPATVTITFPEHAAEDVPDSLEPVIDILWQLGDSPLVSPTKPN